MKLKTLIGAIALALSAIPTAAQAHPATPSMYAVKIVVSDFARATQFYEILGMQAGPQHNQWEWELRWDDPHKGSSIIMVLQEMSERFHVTPHGTTMIISTDDVFATLAALREAGFSAPGEPKIMGPSAIIMVQDPDGNWVELAGPAPNVTGEENQG